MLCSRTSIIKCFLLLLAMWNVPASASTVLVDVNLTDSEALAVIEEMQNSIREHRDSGHAGGIFSRYNIIKVRWKPSFLSLEG